MVKLVVLLVAGDLDLVDIGHDDEIAGVYVRGVDWFVLAPQPMRNTARQAPEHLVIGVDDIPMPRNVLRFGGIGFHGKMTCRVKFCKANNNSTLSVSLSTKAVTGYVLCSMGSTLNPPPTRCAGRSRFSISPALASRVGAGVQATASQTGVNGVVE